MQYLYSGRTSQDLLWPYWEKKDFTIESYIYQKTKYNSIDRDLKYVHTCTIDRLLKGIRKLIRCGAELAYYAIKCGPQACS